jgi:hypothetical protein
VGVIFSGGLEVLDVTLVGGAPIGHLRHGLEEGLSVLYGSNGAGKSKVLAGISSALTGVRRPDGDASMRCRVISQWSGYETSLVTDVALLTRSTVEEAGLGEASRKWELAADVMSEGVWESSDELEDSHSVLAAQLSTTMYSCLGEPRQFLIR